MSTRAPRHSLSRTRVIQAALEIADDEGPARLTIRRLAQLLQVTPMALYVHVSSKRELLDLMIDAVYADIYLPDAAGPWRSELRARAISQRRVVRRHPWIVGMLDARTSGDRPATLRQHEAVLATLVGSGATPPQAISAYLLIDGYVWGFVLQEISLVAAVSGGHVIDASTYPLAALATQHLGDPAELLDAEFDDGLELVLDGVAARARLD